MLDKGIQYPGLLPIVTWMGVSLWQGSLSRKRGEKTLRVFLSYTIADKLYAHKLHSLLSQWPNLRIFTPEMLSAGENAYLGSKMNSLNVIFS
jgi:hypothetical protein